MGGCRQEAAGEEEEQQQEQELPCFLPESQSPESIELEFHIQLKFGCCCLQQADLRIPLAREVDQIRFLRLQPVRLLPSPSLRVFFAGRCFYHQLCTVEPASWVQLRIIAPWLCLSVGQAVEFWLRKFILWLLCQTKECSWMDFLLKTAFAF